MTDNINNENYENTPEFTESDNQEPKPLTGLPYIIAWSKLFPVTAFCIFISIVLFALVNYSTYFEKIPYPDYLREYVLIFQNARLPEIAASEADKEFLAYLKYGAVLGDASQIFLWHGQLWRLLVNIFHHGMVLHIFFNLYALYFLGSIAEKFMGKVPYILFILLCGIAQEIVCQLTIEPGAIGISGVIFGIFGVLMVVKNQDETIKRIMTPQFIKSMIIQLFIFMVITYFNVINIANVGHVSGLVYGLLFAFSFYKNPNIFKKVGFVILNLLIIPGLYYVYKPVNNPDWQKWNSSEYRQNYQQILEQAKKQEK